MSDKLDAVTQELAELNRLLAENKKGEVQFEKAEARFQELLEERDEALREEIAKAQPARIPGQTVHADGADPMQKVGDGNRYQKALRDITRGVRKWFSIC